MSHFAGDSTPEKRLIELAAQHGRPIVATFELLPLCNLRCGMCYVRLSREEMEARGRLRTAQEWIALAGEMARAGVLFMQLTGGEPLLYPELKPLYLALKQMGMILTINTNGTLIHEEWAAFFGAHKPRRINVTLYGGSAETYAALCRDAGGYEKAVRGIRLLKAAGVDVKINGSVTPENVRDMDAIYALGRELDAPVHMDTYMVPCVRERSRPYDQQARLSPEDAAKARVKAWRHDVPEEAFEAFARYRVAQTERGGADYGTRMTCLAGKCAFAVNWQGEMRPCVTFSSPSIPVFETGFEAAWARLVRETGALRTGEKCASCSLRPLCDLCAANAVCETGSLSGVPSYLCRYAEETLRLLKAHIEP